MPAAAACSAWDCAERLASAHGISFLEALGVVVHSLQREAPLDQRLQLMSFQIAGYEASGLTVPPDAEAFALAHSMTIDPDKVLVWWQYLNEWSAARSHQSDAMRESLYRWGEEEKGKWGSYPKIQSDKDNRETVRQWATRNNADREAAEEWARNEGWGKRGRPSNK